MANFFVRKTGNDSNAGTSAGAAWLTIGKALGATGIASGDQVFIGAGTYREVVTVNMTSATAETKVIADVDGAQTGDAGPVIWTAYTTDDNTAPSANATLNLNGRDFLTFEGFLIQSGNAVPGAVNANTLTSTDITFRRCVMVAGSLSGTHLIYITNGAGVALNWTLDSCEFYGSVSVILRIDGARHTADYDLNMVIRNCLFSSSAGQTIFCSTSGAGAGFPGGVIVLNCTVLHGQNLMAVATANWSSTTFPNKVYNCFAFDLATGLSASTSGQIVEDFNVILATTARSNVSAGANSIATFAKAPSLDWGYARLNGFLGRDKAEPRAGSTLLGFGNQGSPAPPAVDLFNRPRPAGGSSTSNGVGALERHDTGAKELSVVDAAPASLKLTGPADHDLVIPVTAAATTLTARVQYDANHGTTNKPQAILQANGEIGVTAQTATAVGGTGAWETLTLGPFTPTAAGFVTLRLVSRAAAGNGIAYFDTITSTVALGTGSEDYFRRGEAFPAATTSGTGGGGKGGGVLFVSGQNIPCG